MRAADARGFIYALEPERRRRQWQLDAAMARIADLHRGIGDLELTREKLEQECVSQAAQAGRAWVHRADPIAHSRLLRYIATLQQSRADAQEKIVALAALMQQARADCSLQQQKLEVLDRHRHEARKDHSIERHRKDSTEADQDWAARDSHRTLVMEASR
jgi:septal ring factor EnvC (AmiA/AmiB activator)